MLKWILAISLTCLATLSAETKVLAFAGSTRADSVNKKLIQEAAEIATKKGANVTVINLGDYPLPFYDGDLETKEGMPVNAKKLRHLMQESQVILIASPEHNSSIPALLKNALDWASRSEKGGSSREAYKGKKFVLLSASPGKSGGQRGLVHLRSIIEDVGGEVLSEQISVPNAYTAFDTQGHLVDPQATQLLQNLIQKALKGLE